MTLLAVLLVVNAVLHGVIVGRFGFGGNEPARRLYHRLSFRETDSGPTHRRMEWSCVAAPADEPPEA